MRVRIVRDSSGAVVCAVPLEASGDEVLIEPILDEGDESEDLEISATSLLNPQELFSAYQRD